MSKQILAVISRLPQLRSSVRSTAQRFAFWANPQGICQKSYTFLARDRHMHRSTALRHVGRLVALNVLEKDVVRLRHNRCAINGYRFTSWVMALVHERAGGSRMKREQPSREKKKNARAVPEWENNLRAVRELLAQPFLMARSP